MTYGQLAEAAADRQDGRRSGWRSVHHLRRQPGNDGSVRVWVPPTWLQARHFGLTTLRHQRLTPTLPRRLTPPRSMCRLSAALEDALRQLTHG